MGQQFSQLLLIKETTLLAIPQSVTGDITIKEDNIDVRAYLLSALDKLESMARKERGLSSQALRT